MRDEPKLIFKFYVKPEALELHLKEVRLEIMPDGEVMTISETISSRRVGFITASDKWFECINLSHIQSVASTMHKQYCVMQKRLIENKLNIRKLYLLEDKLNNNLLGGDNND